MSISDPVAPLESPMVEDSVVGQGSRTVRNGIPAHIKVSLLCWALQLLCQRSAACSERGSCSVNSLLAWDVGSAVRQNARTPAGKHPQRGRRGCLQHSFSASPAKMARCAEMKGACTAWSSCRWMTLLPQRSSGSICTHRWHVIATG